MVIIINSSCKVMLEWWFHSAVCFHFSTVKFFIYRQIKKIKQKIALEIFIYDFFQRVEKNFWLTNTKNMRALWSSTPIKFLFFFCCLIYNFIVLCVCISALCIATIIFIHSTDFFCLWLSIWMNFSPHKSVF